MSTKAAIRKAVDSVRPLHLRKSCSLGPPAAWLGRGNNKAAPGGGSNGLGQAWARQSQPQGAAANSGGSAVNGSLVQGARRASPSLVQGRAAPSLVQGRVSTPSLVQGRAQAEAGPAGSSSSSSSRPSLVQGRRSTLNGVVKLANGQVVSGTKPTYRGPGGRSAAAVSSDAAAAATPGNRDGSSDYVNGDSTSDSSTYESDLVVVLDMDECLIHSQFLSQQRSQLSAPDPADSADGDPSGESPPSQQTHGGDKYRQPEARPTKSTAFHTDEEAESIVASNCEYFRIHLPDGDLVHVNKRPNLDEFLSEVTAKFETHVFTAAMSVYAEPLLDRLDPTRTRFRGRFFRESCVLDPDLGVYVKDLGYVLGEGGSDLSDDGGEDKKCEDGDNGSLAWSPFNERRVVLVDNNPLSFLANPSNGILVSNFYDDPKDATLEAVMELLHELDEAEDVRPVLDAKFGLKDALKDVMRCGGGWR